jgi:hypothetical protein
MIATEQFELEIFRFIDEAGKGQGREAYMNEVATRIGCNDAPVLTKIVKNLYGKGFLSLGKWEGKDFVPYPPPNLPNEDAYFWASRFPLHFDITAEGRRYFEQLEERETLERSQAETPAHEQPIVFISCGQYTQEERHLGNALERLVDELTSCKGYFAQSQTSLDGLSPHIFDALNRCVGLVAVMHCRGDVTTLSGKHIRASVWIEQEIAIASFLVQVQQKNLPVALYIQRGIKREGLREQLILNPVEFENNQEVVDHFKMELKQGRFIMPNSTAPPLRAEIAYKLITKTESLHRYRLEIIVTNTGASRIEDYWIDLQFPKVIIDDEGTVFTAEVAARATQTHRFFRWKAEELTKPFFPGDSFDITFPDYRMDNGLLRNKAVQDQRATVTVSGPAMILFQTSKRVRDLHSF